MVAVKQSKVFLPLREAMSKASIAYDGQPKVGNQDHQREVDAAYKRGYEEASAQFNQQIVEFRNEVNELRENTFSVLESKFQRIVGEARDALMSLTHEGVSRVLGGFEMNGEAIEKIIDAMIEEAGLGEERIEARLHPLDIKLLRDLDSDISSKHPGLQLVEDSGLRRGDCLLSSRFGKVDGLIATKMQRLKENLASER